MVGCVTQGGIVVKFVLKNFAARSPKNSLSHKPQFTSPIDSSSMMLLSIAGIKQAPRRSHFRGHTFWLRRFHAAFNPYLRNLDVLRVQLDPDVISAIMFGH
jgi:hypothetical protein